MLTYRYLFLLIQPGEVTGTAVCKPESRGIVTSHSVDLRKLDQKLEAGQLCPPSLFCMVLKRLSAWWQQVPQAEGGRGQHTSRG